MLLETIKKRRSIRAYKSDPIEEEKINQLIEALIWAPSACNLQSRKFYFIQDKEEIPLNNFQIFLEGHAIGTHKQHVALRCEKEDNEAYLYNRAQYNVSELRSAYLCLCSDLEIKPRRSLLQNNLINTLRKDKELMIVKNASSHSIGNALFSIYEAIHGKDIYRQMIHGEFVFT